jgi:hypothetical protein
MKRKKGQNSCRVAIFVFVSFPEQAPEIGRKKANANFELPETQSRANFVYFLRSFLSLFSVEAV